MVNCSGPASYQLLGFYSVGLTRICQISSCCIAHLFPALGFVLCCLDYHFWCRRACQLWSSCLPLIITDGVASQCLWWWLPVTYAVIWGGLFTSLKIIKTDSVGRFKEKKKSCWGQWQVGFCDKIYGPSWLGIYHGSQGWPWTTALPPPSKCW